MNQLPWKTICRVACYCMVNNVSMENWLRNAIRLAHDRNIKLKDLPRFIEAIS